MIHVNNLHDLPWHEGMTVQDVLDALRYDYALMTVSVNGQLVEPDAYASTRIPDESVLTVFHLAHGG